MEVKVLSVREGMRITPRGEFQRTVVATYTVDGQGPFTVELPKREYTLEKMKKLIQEEAKGIAGLLE